METLLAGGALLSLFHALIPSHWLPILAIGKQENWSPRKIMWITVLAGTAHVLSTVLLGSALALLGGVLASNIAIFTEWIAPGLLVALGLFYIYRHYFHHHFHLHAQNLPWSVVVTLAAAMFFSPCLEIEGYFLSAGQYGWHFVLLLSLLYGILTISGMLIWMRLALHGLSRINWHKWEHNAGLITGVTLIGSGLILFITD
ncbi:MAG: hypothetical protein IPK76_26000 [Lewinellaceae bacterium]|jgi:nickel/cobalt exporter|nr:hypothetical protein [Lewinellaceae bacterium]